MFKPSFVVLSARLMRLSAVSGFLGLVLLLFWTFRPSQLEELPPGRPAERERLTAVPRFPSPLPAEAPPSAGGRDEGVPPPLEAPERRVPGKEILPESEQQSFQQAVFTAMHAVEPLTELEAALPVNEGVSHFATNGGQGLTARFLREGGVTLAGSREGQTWKGTLRVDGAGGEGASGAAGWRVDQDATRVERPAGLGVTEWYVNRGDGLEHGFTLTERPRNAGETGFSLDVRVEGFRVVEAEREDSLASPVAEDLFFEDRETGRPVLAYRNLKVWDASGRELASVMRPTAAGLRFSVRDEDAVYPVTIDPLVTSLEARLSREIELIPGDRGATDNFGAGVALSNGVALVGAPGHSAAGARAGAAYVFVRSGLGWSQQAKLVASDAAAQDQFGDAVALDGNTALIGTVRGEAAYVFVRSGTSWSQQARFADSGVTGTQYFGRSVSLDGNTAAVGVPTSSLAGYANGAVFVYVRSGSTWALQQKLLPSGGTEQENFGTAVSVKGTLLIGGSPGRFHAGTGSAYAGAAHIFMRGVTNVWTRQQLLLPPTPQANGAMGSTVSLDGSTAAVGELSRVHLYTQNAGVWTAQQSITGAAGGSSLSLRGNTLLTGGMRNTPRHPIVLEFARNGTVWTQRNFIAAPVSESAVSCFVAQDGNDILIGVPSEGNYRGRAYLYEDKGAHSGLAVDVQGDTAVVGALDHNLSGINRAGAAWVMQRTGTVWSQIQKLSVAGPGTDDRFGVAVAISGNRIVVGADYDDEGAKTNCGSVSVFRRQNNLWTLLDRMTPAPAHSCLGRSVAISGSDIVAGAPLEEWRGISGNTVLANDVGAVYRWYEFYLYDDIDWITSKISPGSVQEGSNFGFSVAVSGNRLAVGQPGLDGRYLLTNQARSNIGLVSFYDKQYNDDTGPPGEWTSNPVMTWTLSFGENLGVGFSLTMEGNTAVVGGCSPAGWFSNAEDSAGGGAYVFSHNGTDWGPTPVSLDMAGFPAGTGTRAGSSVALSGDLIAVGAFGAGMNPGRVRLFQKQGTQWVKQADVAAPATDAAVPDSFGISSALSGNTLLVGAYGVNSEAGAAYVYRVAAPPPGASIVISRRGNDVVLTWPAGTGKMLWSSTTMSAGTWVKVLGTENVTEYIIPSSADSKKFFRLGPL